MNSRVLALVAALACLAVLLAAPARADQPYTHDGFQLRGALGGGYLSASESYGDGSFNGTLSGAAGSLEVYVGGSPIPGFTVGGFLGGTTVASPSVSSGGQTVQTPNGVSITLALIGPYVDWYPAPAGGFHVLAGASLAALSANDGSQTSTSSGTGFGLNLGAGYDWWVGPSVSLGILARFTYARTSLSLSSTDDFGNTTSVSVTDSMVVPAIFFSATYQ